MQWERQFCPPAALLIYLLQWSLENYAVQPFHCLGHSCALPQHQFLPFQPQLSSWSLSPRLRVGGTTQLFQSISRIWRNEEESRVRGANESILPLMGGRVCGAVSCVCSSCLSDLCGVAACAWGSRWVEQVAHRKEHSHRQDWCSLETFLHHFKADSSTSQKMWAGRMAFFAVGCFLRTRSVTAWKTIIT